MKYSDLQKANASVKTTNIKGKSYTEVNERVRVFRELFPNGAILTDLVSDDGTRCCIKATVLNEEGNPLASGMAYEEKDSSYINKTSYLENCETSAVGRALGFLGIGIDTAICSLDELQMAQAHQKNEPEEPKEPAPPQEYHPKNISPKRECWNAACELNGSRFKNEVEFRKFLVTKIPDEFRTLLDNDKDDMSWITVKNEMMKA